MVSTGVPPLDRIIGAQGYPDKSAILVVGPPGIGKEALGYWFVRQGLERGDFCVYVSRLPVREVLHDERAFGIGNTNQTPFWIAKRDGQLEFDINNPIRFLEEFKSLLEINSNRKIRVVADFLSSLLILNSPQIVYRFSSQLIEEVKKYDAVLIAMIEEGMHSTQVITTMQHLFDGVIELGAYREGLKIVALLRLAKMRGITPQLELFEFSIDSTGMTLHPADARLSIDQRENLLGSPHEATSNEFPTKILSETESALVFDYLLRAFIEEYMTNRLSVNQAGWRSRGEIAEKTQVAQMSLYGRDGKYGPIFKTLLSSGLVEQRFFAGQRGRGGEVVKVRIAYEKQLVKRQVDRVMIAEWKRP